MLFDMRKTKNNNFLIKCSKLNISKAWDKTDQFVILKWDISDDGMIIQDYDTSKLEKFIKDNGFQLSDIKFKNQLLNIKLQWDSKNLEKIRIRKKLNRNYAKLV